LSDDVRLLQELLVYLRRNRQDDGSIMARLHEDGTITGAESERLRLALKVVAYLRNLRVPEY
jgi:hypothetical protein